MKILKPAYTVEFKELAVKRAKGGQSTKIKALGLWYHPLIANALCVLF